MFDLSDIRRLLDAFEHSDWDEIHLSAGDIEVHVSSNEVLEAAVPPPPAAVADVPAAAAGAPPVQAAGAPPVPATPVAAATPPATTPPTVEPAAALASAAGPEMDGAHPIVSPSPGIFWRSPAPGEPPFVEVGQTVSADTPVCIVEVMKLMNQVLAGVGGTVRTVLVENGSRVERGEPMVLIDVDA